MPDLSLTIHHHSYLVNCDPGNEALLQGFAADIDSRVKELASAVKASGHQFSETQMLVFVSLMLAEEIHQLKNSRTPPIAPVLRDLPAKLQQITASVEKLAQILEGESS